jgi:hypothetical protein
MFFIDPFLIMSRNESRKVLLMARTECDANWPGTTFVTG